MTPPGHGDGLSKSLPGETSASVASAVELQPGQYAKLPVSMPYGTFDAWWYCTPNGLIGRLAMPEDVAGGKASGCHHVEEHDDGTISVLPQPGNSNSIAAEGWPFSAGLRASGEPLMRWHGYIRRGVWEPV